jgi:hypothetical protein
MSLSTMVTVEIEVEVFYTYSEDGLEVVNAICQYDLPREVSAWAEQQAMTQLEKRPVVR